MATMILQCKQKGEHIRFSLMDGTVEAGYLTAELADKRLLYATHTVVSPSYQGQGLAQRLVEALVLWAEERGLLIEPICSYIRKLSERYERLASRLETHSEAAVIIAELEALADPRRAEGQMKYFKTGKGQYAEGDVFLGIDTKSLQAVLKRADAPRGYRRRHLSTATLHDLWASPYNEARLLACYYATAWAETADSDEGRERLYDIYMANIERCNNWNLVDASAPYIFAVYWAGRDVTARRQALDDLVRSQSLWLQRAALVSTYGFIRQGESEETFRLCRQLINHPHDLIHKAMGWMLREVGKRIDMHLLRSFLQEYAPLMPRTALRYALEHFDADERLYFMQMKRQVEQA